MRSIHISTDVFAAIWKAQEEGEVNEDSILRRVFGIQTKTAEAPTPEPDMRIEIGYHDPRYGAVIPHGLEIFRHYRGKEYRARAIQGLWMLNATGQSYVSLNELSAAIGAGPENAWKAWSYIKDGRSQRPISDFRDPAKITKRKRWTRADF